MGRIDPALPVIVSEHSFEIFSKSSFMENSFLGFLRFLLLLNPDSGRLVLWARNQLAYVYFSFSRSHHFYFKKHIIPLAYWMLSLWVLRSNILKGSLIPFSWRAFLLWGLVPIASADPSSPLSVLMVQGLSQGTHPEICSSHPLCGSSCCGSPTLTTM